jgi:outer membrane beta-barrel protein
MQRTNLLPMLAAALATLATGARAAEPVVYGPDGAPTVVQNKLYTMTGRFELGFTAGLALNAALVDHYGGALSFTYHPNEWFDFGLEGAGNYTQLSNFAIQEVRGKMVATRSGDLPFEELANAAQMRFAGTAVARLAPFYGKFNLASELKVHFQAYGLLGAGAGLFHHESVNFCQVPGTTACPADQYFKYDDTRPVGQLGLGLRFYLSDRMSLRTELRVYMYPDKYRENANATQPNSGDDKSYLGVLSMFSAGLSTVF